MRQKWTESDYRAVLKKRARAGGSLQVKSTRPVHDGNSIVPSPYRSRLEAAFAAELELRRRAGELDGWSYEPVHFRLPGPKNWYKIDFCAWKLAVVNLDVKAFPATGPIYTFHDLDWLIFGTWISIKDFGKSREKLSRFFSCY